MLDIRFRGQRPPSGRTNPLSVAVPLTPLSAESWDPHSQGRPTAKANYSPHHTYFSILWQNAPNSIFIRGCENLVVTNNVYNTLLSEGKRTIRLYETPPSNTYWTFSLTILYFNCTVYVILYIYNVYTFTFSALIQVASDWSITERLSVDPSCISNSKLSYSFLAIQYTEVVGPKSR